jgi:hypothetical protein
MGNLLQIANKTELEKKDIKKKIKITICPKIVNILLIKMINNKKYIKYYEFISLKIFNDVYDTSISTSPDYFASDKEFILNDCFKNYNKNRIYYKNKLIKYIKLYNSGITDPEYIEWNDINQSSNELFDESELEYIKWFDY